jgi:hypothetical protein
MSENEHRSLAAFLRTDPRDVGCEQALAVLHLYIDLVLDESIESAAMRYPGVAAHLLACGPCADDFDGLLAVAGSEGSL